jgi:hypothetical protein
MNLRRVAELSVLLVGAGMERVLRWPFATGNTQYDLGNMLIAPRLSAP